MEKSTSKSKTVPFDEFLEKFPDEESIRAYLEEERWHGKPTCAHCGSQNVRVSRKDRPGDYHCRNCVKQFNVKTKTIFSKTYNSIEKMVSRFLLHTEV